VEVIESTGLRQIHMIIPAMKKPAYLEEAAWSRAVVECCQAFISLNVAKVTLVSSPSMRNAVGQLKEASNFHFVELNYQPKGALASACMGLASSQSGSGLAIGLCPGDTLVTSGLEDVLDQFIDSSSKCTVVAFEIPQASADSSWSYVHMVGDRTSRIAQIAEGSPSSQIATSGIFLFRDAEIFLASAKWCFVNQTTSNNQYFASSAVNFLIAREEHVEMKLVARNTFEKLGREAAAQ